MKTNERNRRRPQKRYARASKKVRQTIRALPEDNDAKAPEIIEANGYKDVIIENREDSFLI